MSYPLGEPVNRGRPAEPAADEWQPVDGSPYIQRNTRTGMMRNVRPPPGPEFPWPWPWPNFGIPPTP